MDPWHPVDEGVRPGDGARVLVHAGLPYFAWHYSRKFYLILGDYPKKEMAGVTHWRDYNIPGPYGVKEEDGEPMQREKCSRPVAQGHLFNCKQCGEEIYVTTVTCGECCAKEPQPGAIANAEGK